MKYGKSGVNDIAGAGRQSEPRRLPTLRLNEAGRRVTDIHDFRSEHFDLEDYDPHPSIRDIPVLT